jgi:hypothetical protein
MGNIVLGDERNLHNLIEDIIKNNPNIRDSFPDSYTSCVAEAIIGKAGDDILGNLASTIMKLSDMKRFAVIPNNYIDENRYSTKDNAELTEYYDTIEEAISRAMELYARKDVDGVRVKDIFNSGTKLEIKK